MITILNELVKSSIDAPDFDGIRREISCKRHFSFDQIFLVDIKLFSKVPPNHIPLIQTTVGIELNPNKLWEAYQELKSDDTELRFKKHHFSEEDDLIFTLLENKTAEVITHLKSFNGSSDNYLEIAKLIQQRRGQIAGRKFGI